MDIKWLGHASVLITSDSGTRIITDPYTPGYHPPPGGTLYYGEIQESADIVVVTHEHPDHNNIAAIKGNPEIVRGIELRKTGTATVKDITFRVIPCYHDSVSGSSLGDNNMICFNVDGLNICHTGDIGHELSDEQLTQSGRLDILLLSVGLLVPVGDPEVISGRHGPDNFTFKDYIIDADVANRLYDQLKPKVVIPVHFGNSRCGFKLVGVDEFLEGKKNVRHLGTSDVEINRESLPEGTGIIVLEPAL
jgi:L-ascorbate metabolism protein UlaG (beta-lactamase superfamily)